MTAFGTLYGVGVGPGASDLMTLRAVEVARRADVLALPRATDHAASQAWRIAKPAVGEVPGQLRIGLTFPMVKDPPRLRAAWERATDAIGEHLIAGRSVAFLAEGDPSVYSSFTYVRQAVRARWPEVTIEVVPGVTSITAVPARADVALADGRERIAIIPATWGTDDLRAVLRRFDTTVIMKIGSAWPAVHEAIVAEGLAGKAVFVSRATMPEERIVRAMELVKPEHCDCFAMCVVTRRERAGAMGGEALDELLEAVS
jgi:precorrin-2/cobalt-factor-2 C20-methyltransferase